MTTLFPSGDFPEPLLRVAASGDGGKGYKLVHDGGRIVPSVTTVSGILDKPGIQQWSADLVAAKAVVNIDALLNRTPAEGVAFLRFAAKSELRHAAAIGTNIHAVIAADLAGSPRPDILFPEVEEMLAPWEEFRWEHSIEPHALEVTLVNRDEGFAGTADGIGLIDGIPTLWDNKSSRNLWPENLSQLAALGSCDEMMVLDPEGPFEHVRKIPDGWTGATRKVRGEERAVTRWRVEVPPPISRYAIIHIRPSGHDAQGDPHDPFCRLEVIDQSVIDAAWMRFQGCMLVKRADREKQW